MGKKSPESFYWDACAFLAFFKKEKGWQDCEETLRSAEARECRIVTSALSITECLWPAGKKRVERSEQDALDGFFEADHFVILNVDRFLAADAQQIVWKHDVKPKDAIHVVTALKADVDEMHTFDKHLLGLSGLPSVRGMKICKPGARQKRIVHIDDAREKRGKQRKSAAAEADD